MAKSKETLYTEADLVENPNIRIPVCLCIDASKSMSYGGGIKKLQLGIKKLYEEIIADESIKYGLELAIVVFSNKAKVIEPFSLILERKVPVIKTAGNTVLGTGVLKSLEILEERKKQYRQYGVSYFQPWLIIMTDGGSFGESKEILKLAQLKSRELEKLRKLTVMPVAIGKKAKKNTLAQFSYREEPVINIDNAKFSELFVKIAQSISAVADEGLEGELDVSKTPLTDVDEWEDF